MRGKSNMYHFDRASAPSCGDCHCGVPLCMDGAYFL